MAALDAPQEDKCPREPRLHLCVTWRVFYSASSSVTGAVGMTTSGESESDDSEMGRLQGISRRGPLLLPICLATTSADGLRNDSFTSPSDLVRTRISNSSLRR